MYAVIHSDVAGNRIVLLVETEEEAKRKVAELMTSYGTPDKLYWYGMVNKQDKGKDAVIESTRLWSPMDGIDKGR